MAYAVQTMILGTRLIWSPEDGDHKVEIVTVYAVNGVVFWQEHVAQEYAKRPFPLRNPTRLSPEYVLELEKELLDVRDHVTA